MILRSNARPYNSSSSFSWSSAVSESGVGDPERDRSAICSWYGVSKIKSVGLRATIEVSWRSSHKVRHAPPVLHKWTVSDDQYIHAGSPLRKMDGSEAPIPSSKTPNRIWTFSAMRADSHWKASLSLLSSLALTDRSCDTDRSTYMTLHETFSMVALISDQSCDQIRFHHGVKGTKGQTGSRYGTTALVSVLNATTGQAENQTAGRL